MQRITFFERMVIESGLRAKKSVRGIALSLKRDHRVIQHEVNRNTVLKRPYSAKLAERLTKEREQKRHRPKLEKLKFTALREHVVAQLQADESPEQIVGTLKKYPPANLVGQSLCPETIYQYIYSGQGRYENLWPHLRKAKKKRQPRHARKIKKSKIPDRISIHERPDEINCKKFPGIGNQTQSKDDEQLRVIYQCNMNEQCNWLESIK